MAFAVMHPHHLRTVYQVCALISSPDFQLTVESMWIYKGLFMMSLHHTRS